MDPNGQIYFEKEENVSDEDRKRLYEAWSDEYKAALDKIMEQADKEALERLERTDGPGCPD